MDKEDELFKHLRGFTFEEIEEYLDEKLPSDSIMSIEKYRLQRNEIITRLGQTPRDYLIWKISKSIDELK